MATDIAPDEFQPTHPILERVPWGHPANVRLRERFRTGADRFRNAATVTDSAWDVLWQTTDTDWYLPATDLERFQATIDELMHQIQRETKIVQLLESIAAFLIRRLTSVVRLATRLVGLIPKAKSRRGDGRTM